MEVATGLSWLVSQPEGHDPLISLQRRPWNPATMNSMFIIVLILILGYFGVCTRQKQFFTHGFDAGWLSSCTPECYWIQTHSCAAADCRWSFFSLFATLTVFGWMRSRSCTAEPQGQRRVPPHCLRGKVIRTSWRHKSSQVILKRRRTRKVACTLTLSHK